MDACKIFIDFLKNLMKYHHLILRGKKTKNATETHTLSWKRNKKINGNFIKTSVSMNRFQSNAQLIDICIVNKVSEIA